MRAAPLNRAEVAQSSLERRQRAERIAAGLPPLLVAAQRVAATVLQGVHGRRRAGTGETFWQFRRYQTGDPASRIDWRRSAKTQALYVREQEWEAAESVWLWRDPSPSMDYRSKGVRDTKRARAELILLAIAALLLRGGEQVAILGRGPRLMRGVAALDRLAETLGRPEPSAPSLPAREVLPRFAQAVLIGDFLSPLEEVDAAVKWFTGSGVSGHLLQVLDPSEETLPFVGRAQVTGLEGEGSTLIGRIEAVRDEYRSRLAAQREGLAAIARASGWTFLGHRTDRPPETAVLALYMALSGNLGRRR